ncbi:hemerythrin domain-containing protein [Microvirga terrestris]|uniref:Hemerythrin domain-containing protein n=1 Tax=Microvirga terrestris TaxID=2791024 RepID=A0ABS0HV48_9HYPH|nr:hemerythrin domain-containing protein [Microvirga terrestris]MBF9197381.1 hemerythrin domain-containing protein [Microvirga terrestris]
MSQAIDDLRHEHDAILSALDILDRVEAEARQGTVAAGDISAFIGFLKEFVDKCHHGKEEGMLFPALGKAGASEREASVPVLLSEHERGRALVKAMEEASSPALQPERFSAAAKAYSRHLRAHIEKENKLLFPKAEQILDEVKLDMLHRAFVKHEDEVIGQGRHEELHHMLHSLKAKYFH